MSGEENKVRVLDTDVLVLGCGPAGLLAALEAKKSGCRVLAIDKGTIGKNCSAIGAKQLAATGSWSVDGDNSQIHYDDTLRSGCYINNEKLVSLLVKKAGPIIQVLQELGMPFERDNSGKDIAVAGPAPGHSKARSLFFGDITGKLIVDVIYTECRRRGVRLFSEYIALALIKNEREMAGALIYDLVSGSLIFVHARTVILATGGIGCLYELTSNPVQNTGDGIALALQAGVELMDLEFVQFYPVTVLHPQILRGMNLNSHHYGAKLINSKGERFILKYFPEEKEHLTRDKLSQSIYKEILSGNAGPHGGIFMDATMIPEEVYTKKLPTEWKLASRAGINLTQKKLEVAPSAHYYMGGIRIDEKCCTNIRGLFAAGECTAGVQGANRLAGNGLTEALVFGAISGQNAALYAANVQLPQYQKSYVKNQLYRSKEFSNSGESTGKLKTRIQKILTQHIGVVRQKASLEKGIGLLKEINSIKVNTTYGDKWNSKVLTSLSVQNMLLIGQAIALAALQRKESRGAHYRSDYPDIDNSQWKINLIVKLDEEGKLNISRKAGTVQGGVKKWFTG